MGVDNLVYAMKIALIQIQKQCDKTNDVSKCYVLQFWKLCQYFIGENQMFIFPFFLIFPFLQIFSSLLPMEKNFRKFHILVTNGTIT